MGPECHKCRVAIPYEVLAAALTSRGFASGTLIAATREDAGNLRRMFPEARIVRLERPPYAPPLRSADLSSKVAVVWRKGPVDSLPKGADEEFTRIAGAVTPAPEQVIVPWQPYPATAAPRRFEWTVVVAQPKARD